jgi:hypothetical protein
MLCSQKTTIYIDFGERHQAKAYYVHGARANKLLTSYLTSTVVGKKVLGRKFGTWNVQNASSII